jgi:hypothetical protein
VLFYLARLSHNEAKAMTKSPADSEHPDVIAALPPFVSVKRTGEVLGMSRPTVWRRIKDGTFQVASGSLGRPGSRTLIIKASIERFAAPAQVKP